MNQFFEQILKDYPEFKAETPDRLICEHNDILLCVLEDFRTYYVAKLYTPVGALAYYYTWQALTCKTESMVITRIKQVLQLLEKIDSMPDTSQDPDKLLQLGFFEKTEGEYWLQLKDLLIVIIIPHIMPYRCYLQYKVEVSNGPYSILLKKACNSLDEALSKLID